MVDARDLKSLMPQCMYEFEPRPGHQSIKGLANIKASLFFVEIVFFRREEKKFTTKSTKFTIKKLKTMADRYR